VAAPDCAAVAVRATFNLCQILCPQVQSLRPSKVGDLDLLGDTATRTFRPLVPRDLRQQVFDQLQSAAPTQV
jgi:hypothetical protein